MKIIANLLAAVARWRRERDFEEGFHGATRRECKRLGPSAVRDRLKFPGGFNAPEHTTAEAYLARIERLDMWRNWVLLAAAVIVAGAAIAKLVVG